MPHSYPHLPWLCALALVAPCGEALADRPLPLGNSTVVISHDTLGGSPVSYSGERDYSGLSPADAINLGGAPNIGAFNADNILGRRSAAAVTQPGVQSPDETLMRHGIYKVDSSNTLNIGDPFFAAIDPDGEVTMRVEGITFDRPVQVIEDTFLLHLLWDEDQVDAAGQFYISPHNHHIAPSFRDLDLFSGSPTSPFRNDPPNYRTLDGLAPTFTFHDATSFDVAITFPYALMQHFQDSDGGAPPGVPAPGGFLEPFHFHIEYLVVPEPQCLLLLALAAVMAPRRREPV